MPRIGTRSLWLPFTQMSAFESSARSFVRGEGNFLIDASGKRVFDAVSSIWTTVHGHCHPSIVQAISEQAARLDHSTLLGASNPPAEELAHRLTELLGLDYAFFASDGASAVEAALKMALQFWQHAGQPQRTRFVRLVDAYHGDTAGAMSVSGIALFKQRFGAVTFESLPYGDAEALSRDDVAAVIVEPLVQAAAGMRIVTPDRYAALRGIEPLLIVDEIATGFGRTATMFALEQLDLEPDIVCLGKGLTGGTLALSATMAKERVFRAFLGRPSEMKHFFHGHSYAGNPIACAAALASLNLFRTEQTLDRVRLAGEALSPLLEALALNPRVRSVRRAGFMIGIELAAERFDRFEEMPPAGRVANELYERGHFTRPIGEVIQLVPPLSSTPDELRDFIEQLADIVDRG